MFLYGKPSDMIIEKMNRRFLMKINLADNIRAFRKQRSLTQEQLSEVLGVTAGAVYKWGGKVVRSGFVSDCGDGGFL